MRSKMALILVLTASVVGAGSIFYYLRAQQPEPLTIQVDGKTIVLKPGENVAPEIYELARTDRELAANSEWVLIGGQWEPLAKGVPFPLDVQQLTLPEGHSEFPAETVWVIVQGEKGPIEVPVPLDIPTDWVGRYQSRTEGNAAHWDYAANAGRQRPIFSTAALTEAQWQATQGEPHGEALFSYGNIVWAYSPALDNPYSGSEADEFQQMVGEAYEIAGSLATFFMPADPAQAAYQVLLAYLNALRAGRYAEAARIYGGSYEMLIEYNPQIDPQNQVALLEAACTVNGFMCHLVPKSVNQAGASHFGIHLTVEFRNPDGSTFELPCAKPGSSGCVDRTQFDYTVRELFGAYRVMELPVYVQ